MVNTTRQALTGVRVTARVTDLTGQPVATRERTLDLPANRTVDGFPLAIDPALAKGPVLVRTEATARDGTLLSENFYWQAARPDDLKALAAMPQATVRSSSREDAEVSGERTLRVDLANAGATPALQAKLTLFDARGEQILPAYFSDNYLSLLPGEARQVTVRYPSDRGVATVRLRGWNIADTMVGPAAN